MTKCHYCGENYDSKYYNDPNYAMWCSLAGGRPDDLDNDDKNVCYDCIYFVGEINDGNPPFECNICKNNFSNIKDFVLHIKMNQDLCSVCDCCLFSTLSHEKELCENRYINGV